MSWRDLCLARTHGRIGELPVKKQAKARRIEKKTVCIIRDGERILLHKRPSKGLLAGLYELPNLEGQADEEEAIAFARERGLQPLRVEPLPEAKHIFSHVEWHMTGYMIRVADMGRRDLTGQKTLTERRDPAGKRRSPRMATFWWRWRRPGNTTRSRRPLRPTPAMWIFP